MKKYLEIIKLYAEKRKLDNKINFLKPEAVKELYKDGYSMDDICVLLKIGKINVVNILNGKKTKMLKRGRKK